MKYIVQFRSKAMKDLAAIGKVERQRVLDKIQMYSEGMSGDVKHLSNYSPDYRLRVGDYRVLFDIEKDCMVVGKVLHRREAYKR